MFRKNQSESRRRFLPNLEFLPRLQNRLLRLSALLDRSPKGSKLWVAVLSTAAPQVDSIHMNRLRQKIEHKFVQ